VPSATRSTPTPAVQEPAESAIGQPPTPDPEVARQRRLQADREGAQPAAALDEQDPISILAPVVRRDDAELSATETRDQALSDADHFGALHAIWMDQCRAEAYGRYAQAVRDHAEPADAAEILKDTDHLWRTIHAAELAGFDGAHVIRAAITGRPFTGARSHSAVLDARIRTMTGEPPPKTWDSWTARLPRFADPELGQYMAEVAAAMDDRQRRIGQHAAQERPLWATQALGQVPADRHQRAGWEARAGQLGAYREMFGWDHPGEAIGPEPAATFPEARAEWHAAFAVMARVEGIDVRGLSDGQLLPAAGRTRPRPLGRPSMSPRNCAPPASRNSSARFKPPATPTRPPPRPATATRSWRHYTRRPPGPGPPSASGPPSSGTRSPRPTTPAANGKP
jgi:hypothetical protein